MPRCRLATFNDFVQVVRLRAGIRQALEAVAGGILDYATLGEAIFKSLSLPFRDYGNRDAEPELAPVKRKYEEALQDYLLFRALADLRRSWRIVLPNLEQCALLDIDYLDLDEIVAEDSFWEDLEIANSLAHPGRREFLAAVSTTSASSMPSTARTTWFRTGSRSSRNAFENN